ncbi:MAG: hypothetical protein ACOCVZ_01770 [Gemmatimonadota bacterium]
MTDQPAQPGLRSRPGIRDAIYALLFMFPAAGITALVYRFPLPFGGYVRGPAGVWDAMLATIFFGLAGGFLLVPALAAGAGILLRRRAGQHPLLAALAPLSAALLYALFLAFAEHLFGV